MATEHEPIEIDNSPELLRLIEAMQASGEPCILRLRGRDIAVMRILSDPLEPKPTTTDSHLWKIVGMARSDGPTDVATDKHKYLAEAYADLHDGNGEG